MALTDEGTGTTMLVQPSNFGGSNGFGDGFGGSGWWILLLFILLGGGAWGNNGGYGGTSGLYPWMNQSNQINDGFRDQMINSTITGIQNSVTSGFGDVQTALCSGFAGVNAGIANGFAQAEIAANGRQMANMNQNFGMQTAMMQGFNQLGSQFADCCCENRLATCQTQNIIQNEGNATRFADANNTRDILTALNGGIQSIKDQLCADKIDAKNDEISQLRQELLYARGQASQDVQTAALRQSNATTANQLIAELRSCPIPSMPVYGQTPIFTCNGGGCGCGCGGTL